MKKKIKSIVLFLLLLAAVISYLTNCRYMYGKSSFNIRGLWLQTHDIFPVCFVSHYNWTNNSVSSVTLTISDEYEGYQVTSLGGHAVSPFLVNVTGSRFGCGEDLVPEDAVIRQYHMTINLNSKIREADDIEMDVYHCVGTNRYVQVLVTIDCPEDNPFFYSEEGRLYKKSDNSLVEGFFYEADYADE